MSWWILNPCVPDSNLGNRMIFYLFIFFYVFLSLILQCKFANSTLLSLLSFSYFITPYDAQASSTFSALISVFGLGLACQAKGQCCRTKISTLAKTLTEKKRVKVRSTPATTLQKRPVKITIYLGLYIIIRLKFTIIFDKCAILNVLNYLTKNFES